MPHSKLEGVEKKRELAGWAGALPGRSGKGGSCREGTKCAVA